MKKTITFLLFMTISLLFGQHQRIIYDVSVIQDSLLIEEDVFYLDIHESKSIYYNKIHFENDSINKISSPDSGYLVSTKPFYTYENKKTSYFEFININVYEVQSNDEIKWEISDDIKKWENYTLQKATTRYGGRDWEVWFTNEIPIPEGPLFLKGLPGLIVEAKDTENQYSLKMIGIKKISDFDEIDFLKNAQNRSVKINLKQYKKLKIEFYQNPLALFYNTGTFKKGKKVILEDGTMISNMAEVKEAEKRERKRIKRNNNPPNLDFKVNYK